MRSPNDVHLPAVTNRELLYWGIATALAFVAAGTYVFVTDPVNRPTVIPLSVLLVAFITAIGWSSMWVDPIEGALTRVRWRCHHRRVHLRPGTPVALVRTLRGDVLLRARPPGSRFHLYVQLLRIDVYVEKSLDPALLRLLATTLDQHIGDETRPIADTLRAQAQHTEAGGDARTSPLADSELVIPAIPVRDPPPSHGPDVPAEHRR